MGNIIILIGLLVAIILTLLVIQIIMFELARKRAIETKNNGFFLNLDQPYNYNRTTRIAFICIIVYILFSNDQAFTLSWFLYLLLFVAIGIISDAVVQYLMLYYGRFRCRHVISDMKSLEDEVKDFISKREFTEEQWETSMPLYDEIQIAKKYLKPADHLAFMSIDGGDFVRKFGEYPEAAFDVEPYVETGEVISNLQGLPVKATRLTKDNRLPFKDQHIDMIINEYATFDKNEVARVLKPGGYFIVDQFGNTNLREFLMMYMPFALRGNWNLGAAQASLSDAGFTIVDGKEDTGFVRFRSLNQARSYFNKVVPQVAEDMNKFINFYIEVLKDIKEKGFYELTTYRFLVVARLTRAPHEISQ